MRSTPESGGIGLARLCWLCAGLGRLDDPSELIVLIEDGEGELGILRRGGLERAFEERAGGLRIGFVAGAIEDLLSGSGDLGIRGADRFEARIVLAQQVVHRVARGASARIGEFNHHLGLVLIGRIDLIEGRAKRHGVPEIVAQLGLLYAIGNAPNLGAVAACEICEDELNERLIGLEIDFVMNAGSDGADFFEERDSQIFDVAGFVLFEIGLIRRFTREAVKILEHAIEPKRRMRGAGLLPFDCAEEHADVRAIERDDDGSERACFYVLAFGADKDGVARNPDDGFAGGEIGDDFLVFGLRAGVSLG